MKFYAFLAAFLMFLTFSAAAYAEDRLFVGVSPPIVDLGELERGTTNNVKFYVVTVSEDPITVYLECENGRLDFFNNQYKDAIFNFSEEDTASWVRFLSNPVELKPRAESLTTGYESIKGWREVSFLLEVPRDAEPGYHLIRVKPIPSGTSETQDRIGAMLVGVTSINVIFKVSGDAERKGVILDTVNERYGEGSVKINTFFQNIGTDTISVRATQKIYDKENNLVKEAISQIEYIKPREVGGLTSIVPLANASLGDYNVFTTVSYTTSSAYKNSTLSITQESLAVGKKEDFTTLLLILVIMIIGFAIYRWVS